MAVSAAGVQHVAVLLLHDPTLVARAYDDVDAALARFDLTPHERRLLVAPDRRRWVADPLRPRRVLRALLDEFPASAALAVHATRRLSALDAFFAGPEFERCVRSRGLLTTAFAAFLRRLHEHGTVADGRLPALTALEDALARARRGPPRKPRTQDPTRPWRRAAHVIPVTVPAGSLAVLHAVQQVLFEITLTPVAALADDGPDLARVPSLDAGTTSEHLLAEGASDGAATLAETDVALVQLLEFAGEFRSFAALVARAAELGATVPDANGLLLGLARDGLLVDDRA